MAPLSARCLLLDGKARAKKSALFIFILASAEEVEKVERNKKECSEEVASQVEVVSSVEQAHDVLWYRISYIL